MISKLKAENMEWTAEMPEYAPFYYKDELCYDVFASIQAQGYNAVILKQLQGHKEAKSKSNFIQTFEESIDVSTGCSSIEKGLEDKSGVMFCKGDNSLYYFSWSRYKNANLKMEKVNLEADGTLNCSNIQISSTSNTIFVACVNEEEPKSNGKL